MSFFKLSVLLPFAALAVSCGNKSSNIAASTEEGTWEGVCLTKSDGQSSQLSSTFSGDKIETILFSFSDENCQNQKLKTRFIQSYKIGKNLAQVAPETREIDITDEATFKTILEEKMISDANEKQSYSAQDWKLNVEKEVTDLINDKKVPFPKGRKTYSLISIKDDVMLYGDEESGDETTPETRSTKLNDLIFRMTRKK